MRIKNIILTIIGLLLLGLGIIGLFLPVLPTTPFVMAAVGCLSGTPKLRDKILRIGFIREYVDNYKSKQGLSVKTVVRSLVFLWGMLSLSIFLTQKVWLAILLCAVGIAVTIHICWVARNRSKTTKDTVDK